MFLLENFTKPLLDRLLQKKMVRDFIIHDGTREKRDFGWNSFGRNNEDMVDVVPSRIEYLG